MSVGEAADSVLTTLKERFSHPFLGIFLLAWPIYNWDFLFYLVVSDSKAEQRIEVARIVYLSASHAVVMPFLTAAVYVLVSPWTVLFAYKLRSRPDTMQRISELKDEQKIAHEKLFLAETQQQVVSVERAAATKELDALKKEVTALTTMRDQLQAEADRLESNSADILKRMILGEISLPSNLTRAEMNEMVANLARVRRDLNRRREKLPEPEGQMDLFFDLGSKV